MDDDQTEEEAIDEPDVGYLDEPDEVEDVLDDRPMKVCTNRHMSVTRPNYVLLARSSGQQASCVRCHRSLLKRIFADTTLDVCALRSSTLLYVCRCMTVCTLGP